MSREAEIIALASTVVHFRDRVIELDADIEDAEEGLRLAEAAMVEAKASLNEAVAELASAGGGRERHAEFPPERVAEINRECRWRDCGDALSQREYLYRSPVYASIGSEVGLGTQDTYVPRSGKEYKCVWLTSAEHEAILDLTKERYPRE